MNWRNVVIVAVVILPLILLFAWGFSIDPHEVPSVMAGKPAPDCQLRGLDGVPVRLSQFRGKPLVVNFWATWCVPCEAEHSTMLAAARAQQGQVQFVGVLYQDEPDGARRYLKRKGQAYPNFEDPVSRCSMDFGVAGVPETFFIDAQGIVRHKEVGPVNHGLIARILEPLLVRDAR